MEPNEIEKKDIYESADLCFETNHYESYIYAKHQFESIYGYEDAAEKIELCKERIYEYGVEFIQKRKLKKAYRCFAAVEGYKDSEANLVEIGNRLRIKKRKLLCIASFVMAILFFFCFVIRPTILYKKAEDLLEEGKTVEAAIAFAKLGNYKDADERSNELWDQNARDQIVVSGAGCVLGITADGKYYIQRDEITSFTYNMKPLYYYILGLCDTENDSNNPQSGYFQFEEYFLNSNGLALEILHEASDDMIAASSTSGEQFFLKKDGTVVRRRLFGGYKSMGWKNIIALSSGSYILLGLRTDGKVEGYGFNDSFEDSVIIEKEIKNWKDIVGVDVGKDHAVGLKADGTVVACGNNEYGQCNVSGWTDIIAVSAGENYTIGLKKDGTVVACGDNAYGQCEVSGWTDIVAISVFEGYGSREEYEGEISFSAGFKADGTVILTNVPIVSDGYGRFEVDYETLEKNPKIIIQ